MLLRMIKIQFTMMLQKWGFHAAVCILFAYCLCSYCNHLLLYAGTDLYALYSADSLFALNTTDPFWTIFTAVYPFLLVFPFAFSYPEDVKRNNAPYLQKRMGSGRYFISKLVVSFLGGFLIIFIPFLLNLILCQVTFPHNQNTFFGAYQTSNYFKNLTGTNVLIHTDQKGLPLLELYLYAPILYSIVYLLFFAVFTGILSMFATAFSFFIKQKMLVFIPGFLFFYISRLLDNHAFTLPKYTNYDWLGYVSINSFYGKDFRLFFSVLAGILLFCMISCYIAVKKEHL